MNIEFTEYFYLSPLKTTLEIISTKTQKYLINNILIPINEYYIYNHFKAECCFPWKTNYKYATSTKYHRGRQESNSFEPYNPYLNLYQSFNLDFESYMTYRIFYMMREGTGCWLLQESTEIARSWTRSHLDEIIGNIFEILKDATKICTQLIFSSSKRKSRQSRGIQLLSIDFTRNHGTK